MITIALENPECSSRPAPRNWLGDKGYIGNNMLTPFRKPEGGELLDWQIVLPTVHGADDDAAPPERLSVRPRRPAVPSPVRSPWPGAHCTCAASGPDRGNPAEGQ